MITRLVLVHLCPAVPTAPNTTAGTTISMSAVSSTMIQLFPPNSNIVLPNLSDTTLRFIQLRKDAEDLEFTQSNIEKEKNKAKNKIEQVINYIKEKGTDFLVDQVSEETGLSRGQVKNFDAQDYAFEQIGDSAGVDDRLINPDEDNDRIREREAENTVDDYFDEAEDSLFD